MFMHVTEMIYGQIEEQPVAGRGRWRLLYARQPAQPRVPALLPGYRALCRSSCLAIFCERKQLQATLASWPALSLTDSASCTICVSENTSALARPRIHTSSLFLSSFCILLRCSRMRKP